MDRPVIAVTGPQEGAWGPRICVAIALRLYGAQPVQVRPKQTEELPDFDGVVITGGHDIHPVLYGAEPEVHPNYDPQRDTLEKRVIRMALDRQLPLLGICRGAQLLNVCLGGTLFQDLNTRRNKTSKRRTVLPLKTLTVEPETRLCELLGGPERRINSLHNQAINRLGSGLRISGYDQDAIIQAVEFPGSLFTIGVQWHPEFLLFSRCQRQLFRALVEATRR